MWLCVQVGLAFARFSGHKSEFPPFITHVFRQWAKKFGAVWTPRAVPYLQLGRVPYSSMGFLALLLKSFSQARRYVLDGLLDGMPIDKLSLWHSVLLHNADIRMPVDKLPFWHSVLLHNADNLTYYCPRLIKRGVLLVSDLFDAQGQPNPQLLSMLGPTWRVVYPVSIAKFLHLPSSEWSLNSVWFGSGGKSRPPCTTQTEDFLDLNKAPATKEFVCQSLWAKLKTSERLSNWTKHPWCLIGAQLETVAHALQSCRFHQLDVIDYSLGPHYHEHQSITTQSLPVKLSAPQGLALWTSKSAHWALRNAAKFHNVPPELEVFRDTEARVVLTLTEWQPLAGWANVFMQFHHVIVTVRQSGYMLGGCITLHRDTQDSDQKAKRQRTQAKKEQLAQQAALAIAQLEEQGWDYGLH